MKFPLGPSFSTKSRVEPPELIGNDPPGSELKLPVPE